ncbi:MAG: metallophosphoesterase [Phycisphaerales bacterium]
MSISAGTSEIERPPPRIGERIELSLPRWPEALDGAEILHLSDPHIRRYRPVFRRLIDAVSRLRPDFVCLTGDYITARGDERAGLRVLGDLFDALRPRFGVFASFGNHDTAAFKRMAPRAFPQVNWLEQQAATRPDLGLTFMGTSTPGDVFATTIAADEAERDAGAEPGSTYRVLLAHEPNVVITAAEFDIEWTLAGHTHGGQIRAPWIPFAPHNYSDLPRAMSSGILRVRDSICTISRGVGDSLFDVRLFCPRQIATYVVRRGPLPGEPTRRLRRIRWW